MTTLIRRRHPSLRGVMQAPDEGGQRSQNGVGRRMIRQRLGRHVAGAPGGAG